jgi:anti-sigma factor RsiW
VDTIDKHPVAVVVFHYEKQPIGLYVWPLKGATAVSEKNLRQEGHNLIHWTQSGLNCWAVSDIKQTDLKKFVRLVQELGYTPQGAPKGEGVGIYKYPQS